MEWTCNAAIGRVRSWITSIDLKLNDHKTDAVLLSSRKKIEFITITVGEKKQSIKYLKVMIDNSLTFKEHLAYISRKCAAAKASLARIIPNLGGPRQEKRQLLMIAVRCDDVEICGLQGTCLPHNIYGSNLGDAAPNISRCREEKTFNR